MSIAHKFVFPTPFLFWTITQLLFMHFHLTLHQAAQPEQPAVNRVARLPAHLQTLKKQKITRHVTSTYLPLTQTSQINPVNQVLAFLPLKYFLNLPPSIYFYSYHLDAGHLNLPPVTPRQVSVGFSCSSLPHSKRPSSQ